MSPRHLLAALALALPGCALTSKADPIDIRYFAPPEPPVEASARASADTAAAPALRLGRVRAADHLRSTIVFQKSDVELGAYASDYWTERPTDYVERALRAELYQRRGIVESLSSSATTLDVEVLAFQEIREGDARAARVTLAFSVRDGGKVADASQVTVDVPATTDGLEGVVTAIGVALQKATALLGERVAGDLSRIEGDAPPPAATR